MQTIPLSSTKKTSSFSTASTAAPTEDSNSIYPFSPKSISLKPIESIFLLNGPTKNANRKDATSAMRALLKNGVNRNLKQDFSAGTFNANFASYGNGDQEFIVSDFESAFSNYSEKCDQCQKSRICIIILGNAEYNESDTMFFTGRDLLSFGTLFEILSSIRKTPMAIIVATDFGSYTAKYLDCLPEESVLFGFSEETIVDWTANELAIWRKSMDIKGWPKDATPMDLIMIFLMKAMQNRYSPMIASGQYEFDLVSNIFRTTEPIAIQAVKQILAQKKMESIEERYQFKDGELTKLAEYVRYLDSTKCIKFQIEKEGYGKVLALAMQYEIIRMRRGKPRYWFKNDTEKKSKKSRNEKPVKV